jgi:ribose transport system ATP-binding protein
MTPILQLRNIHKSFGPVRALRGVDMDVHVGEVHALIGENGAGKSTLMKVLSGAHQPDAGTMLLDGQRYRPESPRAGREAGIGMIYQELTIAPHLSVLENITLGLEESKAGWIRSRDQEVVEALERLGQRDIDPRAPAGRLSIGKQQVVEIARVLLSKARVVVMDEPTSSLSASDTRVLFDVIYRLKRSGVAVIYISHFLEEVIEIADRYTVLRDGETTAAGLLRGHTIDDLIPPMIGRSVEELYPTSVRRLGDPLITAENLHGPFEMPSGAGFQVRKGEILGIAGLVGAGRSETLRTLFGLRPASDGTIVVGAHGPVKVSTMSPDGSLEMGLNLLSENRKEEGLAVGLSVRTNLTLSRLKRYTSHGWLDLTKEKAKAAHWIQKLGVRCTSPEQAVDALSGGNQQKLCLARLLHDDSDVLLLDEPTRGIDIGSKADMYRLIHEAAGQGKAVIMTSSYLPELFGVCDTLAVMHRGVLSEVRPVDQWTEEAVLRYATSGQPANESNA